MSPVEVGFFTVLPLNEGTQNGDWIMTVTSATPCEADPRFRQTTLPPASRRGLLRRQNHRFDQTLLFRIEWLRGGTLYRVRPLDLERFEM